MLCRLSDLQAQIKLTLNLTIDLHNIKKPSACHRSSRTKVKKTTLFLTPLQKETYGDIIKRMDTDTFSSSPIRKQHTNAFTKDTSMQLLKDFIKDESGATAVEYGLIAGLIAVVIIGALTTLGGDIKTLFEKISDGIKAANP